MNIVYKKRFIHEAKNMSRKTENNPYGVALPMTELSTLQELERLLQGKGFLDKGQSIPHVLKDKIASNESNIGFSAENNTVVALSARYCALTFLPESLGQLTNLQYLDVT